MGNVLPANLLSMVDSKALLRSLHAWHDLHADIFSIDVNPYGDDEDVKAAIERREQIICALKEMDPLMVEIAQMRRSQWPDVDRDSVVEAETVIAQTHEMIQEILENDKRTMAAAEAIRREVLDTLRNTGLQKRYLPEVESRTAEFSVIVDDHA